jgi:hypothetical protein
VAIEEPTTPPVPRVLTSKSVFSHPEAHPVVLDLVLLQHFHVDWFDWLEDTLFFEIEKEFNTSIADVNKYKILAAKTLHITDAFWDHWEMFEKGITALNGIVPMPHTMQPPDLATLMAGVDIADGIRREEYSDEVSRYCAAVFLNENVHYAPPPLDFCQDFITQPMYTCNDCGKYAAAAPPFEGLCTSCTAYYRSDTPFALRPDAELVKKGFGRNLTMSQVNPYEKVKARFEELDKMSGDKLVAAIKEVPEDIQAAKLISAVDYRNHRAQQLKEQLESLRGWLERA